MAGILRCKVSTEGRQVVEAMLFHSLCMIPTARLSDVDSYRSFKNSNEFKARLGASEMWLAQPNLSTVHIKNKL